MFVWNHRDLNTEQLSAIKLEGNVFLVACPGSGKTRTLTYKIAHELSRLKLSKQFVVAITYTHRAADEISERIEQLGVDTTKLWIGTIHSFCLEWILKPYSIYHASLKNGFRVINSHDTEKIFENLCKPYSQQRITHWDCNFFFTINGYVLLCQDRRKHPVLHIILRQYFETLLQSRQIDFELILFYAYELIKNNNSIGILLSNLFNYILIDEYQDTKEIQYNIIASILKAGKGKTKTFIVGDPNQAIYGSLGGYPITADDFKVMANIDINEIELSQNYRSSARVVEYFGNFNVHETTIESASRGKDYPSIISFDNTITKSGLEDELTRIIKFNIEVVGIPPQEICVLAPQWVHLASMTRKLVASMPEYSFDGPGMVPFSRDIDNFWYKLSRIVLTEASPQMYARRLRWAGEVLSALEDAGVNITKITNKSLLRDCNSVSSFETEGLLYLSDFFKRVFSKLGVEFHLIPSLKEHYDAFFESSQARIDRLRRDGAQFIGDISTFRKVFENRSGITVSTIHGVKGAEYDTVIAYALLEDMVPHFNDPNGQDSAMKLLYVIGSRARKNLHLISERGRVNGIRNEYHATVKLAECTFDYDVVP